MHKLARQIRFSVDPFFDGPGLESNSYASRPGVEGLGVYLSLWVELAGDVDKDTGFVINVVEIDKVVRQMVVPKFVNLIKNKYRQEKRIFFLDMFDSLKESWRSLKGKFGQADISKLTLEVSPYRKISIESEQAEMFYFSEKFEFAAMHKLWNDKFSDDRNFEVFGKCANPNGHGHNYTAEITVEKASDGELSVQNFEKTVKDEFIEKVDHKNLNEDVDYFKNQLPTVENIVVFAWNCLENKFADARLENITVWETDRTFCTYKRN